MDKMLAISTAVSTECIRACVSFYSHMKINQINVYRSSILQPILNDRGTKQVL